MADLKILVLFINLIQFVYNTNIESRRNTRRKEKGIFQESDSIDPHKPNGYEILVSTSFTNQQSINSSETIVQNQTPNDVRFPSNPNTYLLMSTVGHRHKPFTPVSSINSEISTIRPKSHFTTNYKYIEPEKTTYRLLPSENPTTQASTSIKYSNPSTVFNDVIDTVGSFFRAIQTFPNFISDPERVNNPHLNPEVQPLDDEDAIYTPTIYSTSDTSGYIPPDSQSTIEQDQYPNYKPDQGYATSTEHKWNPSWATLGDLNRRQCVYSRDVEFPCAYQLSSSGSFYQPESAHYLRPGDINVIAALGDGTIAGKGALADNLADMNIEYKGVSFATGSDYNWRKKLTLPNILKEFNSRLKGASKGNNEGYSGTKGFNFAKANAVSTDLRDQADQLISKLKRATNVDIDNDWKLITIMIGQNDLCQLTCKHNSSLYEKSSRIQSPRKFGRNVKRAIDRLYKNLPRTFVSVILPPDPRFVLELFNRPLVCHLSSKVLCPCMDGPNRLGKNEMEEFIEGYRDALSELADDEKYQKFDDFAVVLQPGLDNLRIPRKFANLFGVYKTFLPDLSYLAPDCFHPSQKLHALFAKKIWNNLFEPVEAKAGWRSDNSYKLRCPSRSAPFISTFLNSQDDFDLVDDEGHYDDHDDEDDDDEPFERVQLQRRKRKRRRKKRIRNKRSKSTIHLSHGYKGNECTLL